MLRNTIGAMVVVLVAMSALLVGFQTVARPRYATAMVGERPLSPPSRTVYSQDIPKLTSWLPGTGCVDADGRSVAVDYSRRERVWSGSVWDQLPYQSDAQSDVRYGALVAAGYRAYDDCLRAQGADHFKVKFYPAGLFHRFQLIEAALIKVLSATLLIPSLWALRRLDPDTGQSRTECAEGAIIAWPTPHRLSSGVMLSAFELFSRWPHSEGYAVGTRECAVVVAAGLVDSDGVVRECRSEPGSRVSCLSRDRYRLPVRAR
ncbi:hypothetical protein ABH922_005498 [Rhodococcus sp. 27YEA15]|uniref:hypothetical protein n=1 Tax=Rhodococcus sp. 27YEA15 TaxID=3156259 RepID=UPI003C7D86F8